MVLELLSTVYTAGLSSTALEHIVYHWVFQILEAGRPAPLPFTGRETEVHRNESPYLRTHLRSHIQEQSLEQKAVYLGKALLTILCDFPRSYPFRVIPVSLYYRGPLELGQRLVVSVLNWGWGLRICIFYNPQLMMSLVPWRTKIESYTLIFLSS